MSKVNEPRPYDLTAPADVQRLFREVSGYLRTCEREHHGTDFAGRKFAREAIEAILASLEKPK